MTELNMLKQKTPTGLWKEDLAAFTEELEVENGPQNPPTHLEEPFTHRHENISNKSFSLLKTMYNFNSGLKTFFLFYVCIGIYCFIILYLNISLLIILIN